MTVPLLIAALAVAPWVAPALAVASPSSPAASSAAAAADQRLRPHSPRIAAWLATALERSPTVRRLAARVERGDVIVYLDVSRDLGANIAAGLTWMAATPSRRFVRATLRRTLRDTEAIAMIAHELQHVVELLDHPEVRSQAALLALYQRIGHRTADTGRHWDTADAVAQGTLARAEAVNGVRPGRNGDTRKGT